MKLKNIIDSLTAKFAAFVLTFGLAGGAWGENDPDPIPVAQIGDKVYYSLQDALGAGGEVTLLRNVVLAESEQLIVNADATLELNGFSVTRPTGGGNQMMEIYAYLTVQDSVGGSVISTVGNLKCAVRVRQGGTLDLKSGTISGDWFDVYNWSGTVIATGGTFLGHGADGSIFNYNGATISIGGTTQFPGTSIVNWSPSTVSLTGGSYALKPDAAYVASGYAVDYGETMYEIVPAAEAKPLAVPAAWVDADVVEIGTSMQMSLWVDCMENNLFNPAGKTLKLTADITLPANITYYGTAKTGIKLDGYTIDGNGHTLTVTGASDEYSSAIWGVEGTVKNLTMAGARRGVFVTSATGNVVIENVTFGHGIVYTMNTGEQNKNCELIVRNSTLNGWTSFGEISKATFTDCVFTEGNGEKTLRPWVNAIVENCTFNDGFLLDNTAQVGQTLLVGCVTEGGAVITQDQLTTILGANAAGAIVYGQYVAQIVTDAGATTNKYLTLEAAIDAAQDGATIEILDGTWGAAEIGTVGKLANRAKSLTIQAASGASPKFTNTILSLGYDDSSTTRNAAITVRGLAFENTMLLIGNYPQVTVEDCSFVGSNGNSSSKGALAIIESCASNYNRDEFILDQVTVRNCTFDGTNSEHPALRLRDSGNVLITGNTIANSNHNGILLESDTTHSRVNTLVSKTVVVQNNTITEWNAGNVADGGRGIRAALGTMAAGSSVTISGNVFRKEQTGFDSPDFVKISDVGSGNTVDLSGNDWNNMLLSEVKGNSAIYTSDGTTTLASVVTTRKEPVAQIGDVKYETLAAAIDDAQGGDTILLLADATLDEAATVSKNLTITLDGHSITGTITAGSGYELVTSDTAYVVRGAGYAGEVLPAGPDMSGDVINVTAANAQYTLDGAYGNINGKTINFTESVPYTLDLARPTKFSGSGTTGSGSMADPYSRTLNNVTFTSNSGVTLAGFYCHSGHISADNDYERYNYVNDRIVTSVNDGYYRNSVLTGITFSGLTINGTTEKSIDVIGSQENLTISGITFTGCTITNNTNGAIYFNNDGNLEYGAVSFGNCNIYGYKVGIYINGVGEAAITVTNNYIVAGSANNNAIQITKKNADGTGSVSVTGNYLKSDKYTVNLNNFGSNQIVFTGNAVVAGSRGHLGHFQGDASGNFWAPQGATPDASGNMTSTLKEPIADTGAGPGENDITSSSYYSTAVVDTSAAQWVTLSNLHKFVAQIGETKYETFAEAIAAAGENDEIIVLDDTATVPAGWKIADGKLVRKVYVAQIVTNEGATTNKYESLAAAVAAASAGDTVTLLTDIEVTEKVSIAKSIVLDGNGKKITATTADAKASGYYVLEFVAEQEGMSLTVKDLEVESSGFQTVLLANCDYDTPVAISNVKFASDGSCVYANGYAKMLVTGSEFKHEGAYAAGKDPVYYAAVHVGYSGEINLDGCKVESTDYGIATFPSGGTITLTDVDIAISEESVSEQNAGYALFAWNDDYTTYPEYCKDSVITFNSGKVKGGFKIVDKYPRGNAKNKYDAVIHVNGGIFSVSPADVNGVVIKTGYEVVANADEATSASYPKTVAHVNTGYIVEDEDDEGYAVIPEVTEEWKTKNGLESDASVAEIEAELNKSDEKTKLKKWEAYVLNQEEPIKIESVGDAGALTTTLVDAKTGTGLDVTYSLVSIDGESETDRTPSANKSFALTKAEDGSLETGLYKVRVHFKPTGDTSASEITVDSENTVGVLKTQPTGQFVVVPVPFKELGGDDAPVKVASYIRSGLADGDVLHVYNGSNYDSWTYNGTSSSWEKTTNMTVNDENTASTSESPEPSVATLSRGTAAILRRAAGNTDPLVFVGDYTGAAEKQTIAAGWNLVASPSLEPFEPATKFTSGKIQIPGDGLPKNYTFKNGKWGYSGVVEVDAPNGNGKIKMPGRIEVDTLPAGTGFWYFSDSQQQVEW